ncbi:Lsr2 family protein [Streptomyces sp. NPDC048281]|uniref:histone-like nucleoid-structuring protein Lsr2 n=1 Tax=Streptomyces sp. NPDC048281 TaxID=3154715 RepID=UPI00341E576F
MAQKVQVLLIDDLEGGEADETVTFALDGRTYEIDLSTANADKLRGFLDPYVKGGRKQGGSSAGTRARAPKPVISSTEPSAEVYRKWAASNNFEVSNRGRIPASLKEAYAAANA